MIADVPPRVLQLLTRESPPDASKMDERAQAHSATMRALIATDRARGLSNDSIVDSLDRRIRCYLETVGQRGEGDRNSTAYRVARWLVNDFAASEDVAWAYLAEWNTGNTPPLTERELTNTMRSAKRSGSRAPGCAHDRRGSAA